MINLNNIINKDPYSLKSTKKKKFFLNEQKIKRILLPDTLGILTHYETYKFIKEVKSKFPNFHIDFHGHNDYDLSVGNSMEAVRAGCDGLHLTINGMGERAGNTPLSSAVAAIKDFLPNISINIEEKNLFKASKLISTFSGQTVSSNKPIDISKHPSHNIAFALKFFIANNGTS